MRGKRAKNGPAQHNASIAPGVLHASLSLSGTKELSMIAGLELGAALAAAQSTEERERPCIAPSANCRHATVAEADQQYGVKIHDDF